MNFGATFKTVRALAITRVLCDTEKSCRPTHRNDSYDAAIQKLEDQNKERAAIQVRARCARFHLNLEKKGFSDE
jgi:hypothetical protein